MTTHRIAVIGGDGIGPEVIGAGMAVLDVAARRVGVVLEFELFPWSCAYYREHGRMMDADALSALAAFDAIYLGAIGDPAVPDHVSVWEMILPVRQRFEQYVNLRPMRWLTGVPRRLAAPAAGDIDMICVRENCEGEYAGLGSRNTDRAEQTGVFTRAGIARVARYAFGLAESRPRRLLASATKSNALQYSMVLWDEVVAEVHADFPAVTLVKYHVDALAARMVTHPHTLDVIVASNLFGDILTDLGAAISGSLGVAPGANLNPERRYPSMFEPIHGSAPDIAGQGIANPIGAIWAGALMLDHLGHRDAHDAIVAAIESVVADGAQLTPDLGGRASTREVTALIAAAVASGGVRS